MKIELEYTQAKVNLHYNGHNTVLNKDSFVSFILSVLEQVNPTRDYTNITSVQKLLRVLDIEMVPDDSDTEEVEQHKPPPTQPKITARTAPGKGKTQQTPIIKKIQKDDDESESESEE
jgi:hypothetical protein